MATWQEKKAERSKDYVEKLRNPRWQKMRLQVLDRDEWACQICYNEESTLNVHHLYYESGKDPWDYPLDALTTLCESCHASETEDRPIQEKELLFQLKKKGFLAWDVEKVAAAISVLPDGMIWPPAPDMINFALTNSVMWQALHDAYFASLKTRREVRLAETGTVEESEE